MESVPDAVTVGGAARNLSLPVEILARCFCLLPEPLLARLAILHVSRTWRAVAFAFPETWSVLRVSDGEAWSSHLLVDMVLTNTSAAYPVDFFYERAPGLARHGLQEDMALVVASHLPRFRSIAWTAAPAYELMLCSEAPRLESLSAGMISPLTPQFLGGVPQRLRSLELSTLRFPSTCPALATLRHIKSSIPAAGWKLEFLYLLFDICPALESLDLRIALRSPTLLPRRRAPRTLRRLRLDTVDENVQFMEDMNQLDLVAICGPWNVVPQLQSLELCAHAPAVTDSYLALTLDGADSLAVLGGTYTRITAQHAGGAQRTLSVRHLLPSEAGALVRRLAPRFASMRDLTLSSDILQLLAGEACALPSLSTLCVVMYPSGRASSFPWPHLGLLPPMPCLERLDIDLRGRAEQGAYLHQLDEHEARQLLARLDAGLSPRSGAPVKITIRGFPPNVASRADSAIPAADASEISVGYI